jgi:4-carboxymuconolactone decarboxylase
MTSRQPTALDQVRDVVPKLADLTDEVLFGDIWERPQLSKRDRSLLTIGVLAALYRTEQLRSHIVRGLANGLSEEEIGEILTHVAFYAGWPTAVNGAQVAKEIFARRRDAAS